MRPNLAPLLTALLAACAVADRGGGLGTAAQPVAQSLTCSGASTLHELVACIGAQMPQADSNGFVAPTAAEQADFSAVVGQMLQGACSFPLPPSLAGAMSIRPFTDSGNGKTYCVLMEVADANGDGFVDSGWGTFIVYPGASREVSHQAAHPLADIDTELQAIDVFQETDSRSYLMCGADRYANSAASTCQPVAATGTADCAHNTANMFYPATQEIAAYYGDVSNTQIQWHGIAGTTCPADSAYMSDGLTTTPPSSSDVLALRARVLEDNPTWILGVTGDGTCDMDGSDNTEGRYVNGVPAAQDCTTYASADSNRFVHIEQHLPLRVGSLWAPSVIDVFPPTLPPAPTGLTATAGTGQVALSWTSAPAANGYSVYLGTRRGGPYALAGTTTAPSYTAAGLTPGVTYYLVVTATNTAGASPSSQEVSATLRRSCR